MAKKIKLTRKQIKQPDEFLSWTEQGWKWASQNIYYIAGGAAGLIVLLLAVNLVTYLIDRRAAKPQAMLGEAIEIMRAPIIPTTQAPPLGLARYYGSEPERLNATAKALAELADQYRSSNEGQLALMYLGETWEQMRDYPKAADYYQQFLSTAAARDQANLKLGATLGLGRALFEQKKFDEALARFDEVITANGSFKDGALVAAARTWFVKGDKAKAAELLNQARQEFPESYNSRPAGFLLAFWEKNPPTPGASKPLEVPSALDLHNLNATGDQGAPGSITITGNTLTLNPEAEGATPVNPAVGGTAPNALPAPVPPPDAPADPAPVPAPASEETPATTPAQP